jgi:CelD/BcsL family acetyltransferase involved in cellulose biosynthesis
VTLAASASDTIFLTWEWQDCWWRDLGEGAPEFLTLRAGDEVIGIAPLARSAERWELSGGAEVADFLDLIARRGNEAVVAGATLDYLQGRGGRPHFRNLRPDSLVVTHLVPEAIRRGLTPCLEHEDVAPRLALPPSWDAYLQGLSKKDRHELRRKIRRLEAAGAVQYGPVAAEVYGSADLADFVRLHRLSAEDKATFMTPAMERFFGDLLAAFLPSGRARLYFLTLDGVRVAATILFDYEDAFLLYNSGYDPAYGHLSVGLLLKAFCLRDAIAEGRRVFDFLQGSEPYKYDLGGVDTPIYRLRLDLGPERSGAAGK